MKIGYQLKQVRERLAKGLVDKGILRTEKRNFLLFDMATHPVVDSGAKEEIRRRVRTVLTQRTVVLNGSQFLPENLEFRYVRTIALVCAAYAANVLENALSTLGHEARERAFAQTDELLAEYSQFPFGRKAVGNGIGANLPQVITEVSIPSPFPLTAPATNLAVPTGSQQGQGKGAPARSRRRVSERLYPAGFPALRTPSDTLPFLIESASSLPTPPHTLDFCSLSSLPSHLPASPNTVGEPAYLSPGFWPQGLFSLPGRECSLNEVSGL